MTGILVGWAETFWLAMAAHLWQSTLVLVLVALLARYMNNAPARLVAGLWWAALVKLFLPLYLLGYLTERVLALFPPGLADGAVEAQASGVSVVSVFLYPMVFRTQPGEAALVFGPAWVVLSGFWLVGMVAVVLYGEHRASRRPRRGADSAGVPVVQLAPKLDRARAGTGIPARAVRLVTGCRVPEVVGLARPRIRVPATLVRELDEAEIRAILLHEEQHRRRRDPLRSLLARAATVLFFFYPPVWWLARRLHESTELLCDEAVVRRGVDPAQYARSLARALELGLRPTFAPTALLGRRPSSLELRLARLSSSRRYLTMPRHRIALAAGLTLVALTSFFPFVPQSTSAAESVTPTLSNELISELERLEAADVPVQLEFQEAELVRVLDAISRTTGLKFDTPDSLEGRTVTLWTGKKRPLRSVLMQLAATAGLRYEVLDPQTLQVRPIHLAGAADVTQPRLLPESKVDPVYPDSLRREGVSGHVILQALIGEDGLVEEIEVLQNSQPDHPALADSASEAVRQWRYEPATKSGEPVSVYFTVFVEFKLH